MAKSFVSVLAVCFVLLVFAGRRYSQKAEIKPVRLMFYNVENLFDTRDDSLRGDNDFLPGGGMNWNYSRYIRKINALYKTIVAAGSWSPPEIISFCEVENRKVLEDLIYSTSLTKFDYHIIHEDSPDQRGIDVCLIYRADRLNLIDFRYWVPSGIRKEDFVTRSVLCARFSLDADTLHLILNHWPSRRGGVLAGRAFGEKSPVCSGRRQILLAEDILTGLRLLLPVILTALRMIMRSERWLAGAVQTFVSQTSLKALPQTALVLTVIWVHGK